MRKRILSIGFDFPGGEGEFFSLRSDQSLLDADIIVFEPIIGSDYYVQTHYLGKPRLSESSSFALVEDIGHWRSELSIAFEDGKTIFIFLSKFQEVYVDTGRKEYAGTGRNARVTTMVTPTSNYQAIPLELRNIVPKAGNEIRVTRDLGVLSDYWRLCATYSCYEIYIGDELKEPLLVTKTGSKIVGAVIRGGKGTIFLLPPLRFPPEQFVERVGEDEDEED